MSNEEMKQKAVEIISQLPQEEMIDLVNQLYAYVQEMQQGQQSEEMPQTQEQPMQAPEEMQVSEEMQEQQQYVPPEQRYGGYNNKGFMSLPKSVQNKIIRNS